jgi:hypothetical protein
MLDHVKVAAVSGHRASVQEALGRILSSPEFRGSQRSADFLSFAIRRWLDGDLESLRERTIAVEVFGRPADYDPSEESFVRVKASELRKRLHAYYGGTGQTDPVRIELPLGGYQPRVHVTEAAEPEQAQVEAVPDPAPNQDNTPKPRRKFLPALIAVVASLLIVAGWALFWPRGPINRFWQPLLGRETVLISIPQLYRHQVSNRVRDHFRDGAATEPLLVAPREIYMRDDIIGIGAGIGSARLSAFFATRGQSYQIRVGRDVRFADLRSRAAILLGGFSSQWSMDEQANLRFRLQLNPTGRVIDTQDPSRLWTPRNLHPDGRADTDYAVLTRLSESSTGNALLMASGITTFGTQAAVEFALDEPALRELFAHAPGNWSGRNLQAVLSMKIKDDAPGPAKLEAWWFW